MKTKTVLVSAILLFSVLSAWADQPIIADHTCTDLPSVPTYWIEQAKANLHIAYGHTSHGSQVSSGMSGLVGFTGGCGGPMFEWNNGGSGGALDMHDGAMGGDCGYYPQWVNNTRSYLDNPSNSDVNVIMWSWCGQHAGYSEQDMIDKYLDPMDDLEGEYPDVKFVYMTGHLTYWSIENCNARNQQIRDFCLENDKILFDFAHIESFDPDRTFFPYANDDCTYWDANGSQQGNWAIEWQNSHTQGVDWYSCSSAHSQPLNANQKAYAIWWLWARLAGWDGGQGPALKEHSPEIPASIGWSVQLDLDAGPAHADRTYLILGTVSGTTPGYALPGGTILPINWDVFTTMCMSLINTPVFNHFYGTLDSAGRSWAQVATGPLSSSTVGTVLDFAYCMNNPFNFASNSVQVEIIP